jgi:hypothetical protein
MTSIQFYVRILSVGTSIENHIDASTSGGGNQCVLVTPLDTDDSAHSVDEVELLYKVIECCNALYFALLVAVCWYPNVCERTVTTNESNENVQ